jgi:hypothetical protein
MLGNLWFDISIFTKKARTFVPIGTNLVTPMLSVVMLSIVEPVEAFY